MCTACVSLYVYVYVYVNVYVCVDTCVPVSVNLHRPKCPQLKFQIQSPLIQNSMPLNVTLMDSAQLTSSSTVKETTMYAPLQVESLRLAVCSPKSQTLKPKILRIVVGARGSIPVAPTTYTL